MTKILKGIVFTIDALNEKIGRGVAWVSLAMAVVTFVVVILRYVFNMGWIWMQESVTYMHAALFMLAGGYTLLHDGHVRVDIFYRPMDPKRKALVDIFGVFFLLFPTCALILYYGTPFVMDSWSILEDSPETGGLPAVFLLKTLVLLFPILIGLQGLSQAARSILILGDKISPDPVTQ